MIFEIGGRTFHPGDDYFALPGGQLGRMKFKEL